nr:glucosaminidase domain-containing protein [Lentilactobacillus fungorum]
MYNITLVSDFREVFQIFKRIKKALEKTIIMGISIIGFSFANHLIVNASVETDFIQQFKAPIVKISKQNHLYPSVMMAQAIVESDFGRSELSVEANNYFGVKGSYNGQSVTMRTGEYTTKGKHYVTAAQFKKYPSMIASIRDNAYILRHGTLSDPNYYSGTWTTSAISSVDAAMALSSTYATDMDYGNKLNAIIVKYDLNQLDTGASSNDINSKIEASLKKQLGTSNTTQPQEATQQSKITKINRPLIPRNIFEKQSGPATTNNSDEIQINNILLEKIKITR